MYKEKGSWWFGNFRGGFQLKREALYYFKRTTIMTIKEIISRLKRDPKDAWYYVQGTFRMRLYSSRFKWMLRPHILQQFEWRRDQTPANKCNTAHSCLCCGCLTPDLFFSDKACSTGKDKWCQDQQLVECYPAMMSRSRWNKYKKCKNK